MPNATVHILHLDNENKLIEATVAAERQLADGTVQNLTQAVGVLQTTSTALTGTIDHAVEVIDQRSEQAISAVAGTLDHAVDVVDRRAGQVFEVLETTSSSVTGTLDHAVEVVDHRAEQAISSVAGTLDHTVAVVDQRSGQAIDALKETGGKISKVVKGIGRCIQGLSVVSAVASIGGMIWTQRRADRTAKEQTGLANRTLDLRAQEIQNADRQATDNRRVTQDLRAQEIQNADRQSTDNRRVTQEIAHEQITVVREGVHGLLTIANKTTLAVCSLLAFGCIAWIGLVSNWPVFACVGMAAGIVGLSWIGVQCLRSLKCNPIRSEGAPVIAQLADDRSAPATGEVIAQTHSVDVIAAPDGANAARERLLEQQIEETILEERMEATLTETAARYREHMRLESERLARNRVSDALQRQADESMRQVDESMRQVEASSRQREASFKRLNELWIQCNGLKV
ncbi:MAG: hypothetical protein HW387_936 [Parachlamydiales bacterium]|nr:hypothetical protein [Parachlamydiales bacterium]